MPSPLPKPKIVKVFSTSLIHRKSLMMMRILMKTPLSSYRVKWSKIMILDPLLETRLFLMLFHGSRGKLFRVMILRTLKRMMRMKTRRMKRMKMMRKMRRMMKTRMKRRNARPERRRLQQKRRVEVKVSKWIGQPSASSSKTLLLNGFFFFPGLLSECRLEVLLFYVENMKKSSGELKFWCL